jgi:hypothetical protein
MSRYEYGAPGGLLHVDVKKLGRIPDGGGWRAHGRCERVRGRAQKHGPLGYDYVHSAVDDHSRLAYSETLDDERAATCAAFLARALAFFAAHGVVVQRVLTDCEHRAVAAAGSDPCCDRPCGCLGVDLSALVAATFRPLVGRAVT